MRPSSVLVPLLTVSALAVAGCGDNLKLDLCPDDQPGCVTVGDGTTSEELDAVFNNAVDGQVIVLGPGRYDITAALQITANNVTLLGQGKDRTVLSFAGQTTGAQGILVTGDNFTARGFTIEDTAGDGLKLEGVDGVTLQSLRVTWTGGASQDNGAYGLYPVLSKRVLIERCEVSNASDAGIYVGQSEDVIVRNNKVETNVAGIEIENCKRADVYDNRATNNTGGVLVFNLPGLTVGNGTQTRVFANELTANNFENFAPAGNIVGKIPPGTGVAVLAANAVEIFDNVVTDHLAAAISVISFLPIDPSPDDPAFDSYPTAIHVHDNEVSGLANMPTGELGALLVLAVDEYSAPPIVVPDLIWDGVVDPVRGPGGIYPENLRICFENNGDADFLNINFPTGMGSPADQDASVVECTHPPLPAVAL